MGEFEGVWPLYVFFSARFLSQLIAVNEFACGTFRPVWTIFPTLPFKPLNPCSKRRKLCISTMPWASLLLQERWTADWFTCTHNYIILIAPLHWEGGLKMRDKTVLNFTKPKRHWEKIDRQKQYLCCNNNIFLSHGKKMWKSFAKIDNVCEVSSPHRNERSKSNNPSVLLCRFYPFYKSGIMSYRWRQYWFCNNSFEVWFFDVLFSEI